MCMCAKQTQKIRGEERKDFLSNIYINFQILVYIQFFTVNKKALIYLQNKSVPFLLFLEIHCRSPPKSFNFQILN